MQQNSTDSRLMQTDFPEKGAQVDVSIVGGGWSVTKVDLNRLPGIVIGVNDAPFYLPKPPEHCLSMDRLWAEGRWTQLNELHGKSPKTLVWLRRSAVQNIVERPDWLRVFDNELDGDMTDPHFGETPQINGENSGACALSLAYQFKPKRVFLFGFDMQKGPEGEPYWYPPYPWVAPTGATSAGKYRSWLPWFQRAAEAFRKAHIPVINVTVRTDLHAFPIEHPKILKHLHA